jgi:hypothetical protein
MKINEQPRSGQADFNFLLSQFLISPLPPISAFQLLSTALPISAFYFPNFGISVSQLRVFVPLRLCVEFLPPSPPDFSFFFRNTS